MSFLSGNSLWSAGGNLMDRMFGPTFDYTTGIKKPEDLGVSDDGSISQVFTNANAIKQYTQQLITGPLLGNSTFVETGGMCQAPDGGIVPRWSYVDNRMRGADVLPANMQRALGSSGDVFNGIVPGMLGDVVALNPVKPVSALVLSGVPKCSAFKCPVTDSLGNPQGSDTKFLTPALEINLGKCSEVKNSKDMEESEVAKVAAQKSKFDVQYVYDAQPFKFVAPTDLTPYVYWAVAVAAIFGVIIKKI